MSETRKEKDRRYCERQGISMGEFGRRKREDKRSASASARGANKTAVREEKEAECQRLGISMRGLKAMRGEGLV